jgi:hypothetical protein
MSHPISDIRTELVHQFQAASDYTGASTQHQREAAHYQRGRKAGIGEALQLVDAYLRSEEEGRPVAPRPIEEIIAAVESMTQAGRATGRFHHAGAAPTKRSGERTTRGTVDREV